MISRSVIFCALVLIFNHHRCDCQSLPPWQQHGPLQVSQSGHYLQYRDGQPFVWLGSTAWALHQNLSREDELLYLDSVVRYRFTVVYLLTANNWALFEGKNYYSDPPYLDNDPIRLNPAYWQHLGWIIDEAAKRHLHILLIFGGPGRDDATMPFVTNAEQAYQYGNAVGSFFKDKPNIIWCNGMEVDPDDTTRVSSMGMQGWHAMAEGVTDGVNSINHFDGKARYNTTLMTYHPGVGSTSSAWFHSAPWLDFHGAQLGLSYPSDNIYTALSTDYHRVPAKPVVNLKPWFKESFSKTPTVNDWDVRIQAYQSFFAGACGFTYGYRGIFTFDDRMPRWEGAWRDYLDDSARIHMQYLYQLLCSFPVDIRKKVPIIISSQSNHHLSQDVTTRICAVVERKQKYALIYSPQGMTFTVDLSHINGDRVRAFWYDVRKGEEIENMLFSDKTVYIFDPPGEPCADNDWILVLQGVEKNHDDR